MELSNHIQIEINAAPFQVAKDSTVAQALTEFEAKPPYAVLLNDHFLPNSLYLQTHLVNGDQLEVISAIQGG